MSSTPLVLGSASPRRREILVLLGVPFEVRALDVDETPLPGEDAGALGLRVARKKAEAGAALFGPSRFVLTADTVVDVDGLPLGKPVSDDEGRDMIRRLAGRAHVVRTAVALAHGGSIRALEVVTGVVFRPLDEGAIDRYVRSGEGRDKAGGYAIQGLGAALVTRIDGSSSNVVGLPAAETIDLLLAAGAIPRWPLGGA